MEEPVLHVIVIGFHHKKGCQVEFSYPPLIEGNTVESHDIPEEWKHIPSLALPDGAHNFVKDTVFFVLPGRKDNLQTVYGVSCYRQMDAKDLRNKTADVTRSTVQKSVCVLSRLPLFGLIEAKLELITHAYFDERDFSQVALLEQTFNNLNSSLTQSLLEDTQVFLGLSARELVFLYKHKIIALFKLILLERRVLIFGSPVESLCRTLLGVISLFPGMLESGLKQSCNQWNPKQLSPTLRVANIGSSQDEEEQFLEVRYSKISGSSPLTDEPPLNLAASGDYDYTALEIGAEECSIQLSNAREAPESPSIPRDSFPFSSQDSSMKSDNKNQPDQVSAEEKDSLHRDCQEDVTNETGYKKICSTVSEKLSVHAFHGSRKESQNEEVNSTHDAKQELNDSPLAHLEEITHIEAVQGDSNAQSELVGNDLAHDDNGNSYFPEPKENKSGLTLNSTVRLKSGNEIIEDLDSPESISKIDREDCFSWEQDRLQLSIDHDLFADAELGGDQCQNHCSLPSDKDRSVSRDSLDASESGRESVSSDSTVASGSSSNQSEKKSIFNKKKLALLDSPTAKPKKTKAFKKKLTSAFNKSENKKSEDTTQKLEGDIILPQDKFGYPLAIFTKGSVCYPYLSLQYHDILTDVNTRSFLIGATNVLFKQRRQLIDVVVEINEGKMDIRDKELQRVLSLTTADLRFADYLVKTVTEEKPGLYLDGTEWEGSDEWIRAQFKHYLNSLLSTVFIEDSKLLEDFGSGFLSAWRTTHNFHFWQEKDNSAIQVFAPGHPFQGNLSMTDVRMRFNHTLQNSERGRKLNAAVVQTGKYVVQTGKVVGGAFTSAKSAVSTWLSSWRNSDKTEDQAKTGTGNNEEDSKSLASPETETNPSNVSKET